MLLPEVGLFFHKRKSTSHHFFIHLLNDIFCYGVEGGGSSSAHANSTFLASGNAFNYIKFSQIFLGTITIPQLVTLSVVVFIFYTVITDSQTFVYDKRGFFYTKWYFTSFPYITVSNVVF